MSAKAFLPSLALPLACQTHGRESAIGRVSEKGMESKLGSSVGLNCGPFLGLHKKSKARTRPMRQDPWRIEDGDSQSECDDNGAGMMGDTWVHM